MLILSGIEDMEHVRLRGLYIGGGRTGCTIWFGIIDNSMDEAVGAMPWIELGNCTRRHVWVADKA